MLEIKQFNFELGYPTEVEFISNSLFDTEYSDLENNYKPVNYFAFDGLGIDLEDDNKIFYTSDDGYAGLMSEVVSNNNGIFTENNIFGIVFSFGINGYPDNITISFYDSSCSKLSITYSYNDYNTGGTVESTEEYEVNGTDFTFAVKDIVINKAAKLTVKFLESPLPYQAIKIQSIVMGTIKTYDEFKSSNLLEEISILSDDLPMNKFDFEVISENEFKEDVLINVYNNNKYYGTFFVEDCERTANNIYSVTSYNAIKKLDEATYSDYRGMTLLTLSNEISDITGVKINDAIDVVLNTALGSTKIGFSNIGLWGNIPIDTCRYALCAAAYASDLWIDSSRSYDITLKSLPTEISHYISADRIIGESTLKKQKTISSAVYENVIHNYCTFEENKYIEVTDMTDRTIYRFEKPSEVLAFDSNVIYRFRDTVFSDYDVPDSTLPMNYMDIEVTYAGKKTGIVVNEYTYPKKSTTINNTLESSQKNEVKFDKFSLVSMYQYMSNSVPVRKDNSIKKYISSRGTVNAKIILEDEKIGDLIQIETAFDGVITGIITSMNISFGYRDVAEIEVYEWTI